MVKVARFIHTQDWVVWIGEPDLVCQTAMVSACAKTGDFAFARKLFDKMPHKDPITWNVMILGYA